MKEISFLQVGNFREVTANKIKQKRVNKAEKPKQIRNTKSFFY